MKPRNKIERAAVDVSRHLPALTGAQWEWARERLFDHTAFCRGGQAWCSDCGGVFGKASDTLAQALDNEVVCPHCGHKLKAIRSQRQKLKESEYMTIATTCRGMQVVRTWLCRREGRKGNEMEYHCDEVAGIFITPDGNYAVMACNRAPFCYYQDRWVYGTMSIKHRHGLYGSPYAFEGVLYPRSRVLPVLKRNGYRPVIGVVGWELMRMLLTNPNAETLIKSGQDELIRYIANRKWPVEQYWNAVKIAIRNNYKVRDASMWTDVLRFMEELGMDTNQPRYVCPNDLKAAHDRLQKRVERKRKREWRAARRKRAAAEEATYKASKQMYFGLQFSDGKICIRPLKSVCEFADEGEAMHHCVFDGGYYKRENALILSARDAEGKRLETIEFNLDTFKVIQSRGVCNGQSEQHDSILNLMRSNIWRIKKIKRATCSTN